jgi:fructokinase
MTERDLVVAVAGETVMDLVPAGEADTFRAAAGGSPANVAVGLARLGVTAQLLARLSCDVFGRRIRSHLEGNGVDLSHSVDAAEASSLAIVGVEDDGTVDYDFRVDGTADWQWTVAELSSAVGDDVDALHVGSLAAVLEPGARALESLVQRVRDDVTITYDPNVRPQLMGAREAVLPTVERLVALSDVVKVSAEDLDWLHPGVQHDVVARRWLDLGCALVVVTLGPAGVVAVGRSAGVVRRDGVEVEVVDTVGAGDSFMSALLWGLGVRDLLGPRGRQRLGELGEEEVGQLLAPAVLASSLTCRRAGADPPTLGELTAAAP